MNKYKTIYDRFQVNRAILDLTSKVSTVIEKYGAENCILLTVLEGGSYLSSKIVNKLSQDMLSELTTASIKVSSYHGEQAGKLKYEYVPKLDYENKVMIVVDDFCDTGGTIRSLNNYFIVEGAKEVIFVTLLARTKRQIPVDVTLLYGIEDGTDNFYYGCGLDDNGKGRYVDKIFIKLT